MKEKKHSANSFLIVFTMIMIAVVLTWIIPAGEYQRESSADGIVTVVPDSYARIEKSPASVLKIPYYIVKGFTNNASLILVLLFSGGAFRLVCEIGVLQALIEMIAMKLKNRRYLFLVMLTVVFALICSNQAIQIFIPFAPMLVMAAIALGFDSITGIAMLILGGGIGFSTGTLRTTTTLIAQNIAQLPPYSGLAYRFFCMACYLAVTCPLLCMYARRIAADPQSSVMYEEDRLRAASPSDTGMTEFTGRQKLVLAVMIIFMAVMVGGSACLGWNIADMAGVFLWMTIAVGVAGGMNADEISSGFIKGAASMLPAAFLTGMGTSISVIFKDAGIIDTIVHALSCCVVMVPLILRAPALFIVNTIINVFITSGSAQAAVVMPIMVPLSDMLDITRQTAVLAYNFGDGFSNYILPTSSALMGVLGAANVPYGKWMKFMGRIFIVWVVLGCLLTAVAQIIQLGPF